MDIDKIFREIFNLDEETVLEGMSPEILEEWDSLGHLTLISKIEEIYKINFSFEEMIEIENYDDILKVLNQKGVI